MFVVYADASGAPADSSVLFVSGFVSSVEKWQKFEVEWNALLMRYGIEPPFHMKEFAPGVGQYKHWRHDKARRQSFLTDAIALLKKRTNKSFSVGVLLKDLAEMNELYDVPESHRYPYPICAMVLVRQVADWVVRRHRKGHQGGRITLVFEDGDAHQGIFLGQMRKQGPGRPLFLTKDDCLPLQAADFVAWQHARAAKVVTGTAKWGDALNVFNTLTKRIPNDGSWEIIEKDRMLETCARMGWPRRNAT